MASADSGDEDAGDPDDDREEISDTDIDDDAEDDDNSADGIDMSDTDDGSDSGEGQASEESLNTEEEPETNNADDDDSGTVESGSYDDSGTNDDESDSDDSDINGDESDNYPEADYDESAGDESSPNDNVSDDPAANDEPGDKPDTFESQPDNDDPGTEDDASDDEPGIDDPANKDDASESHSSQNTENQKDAESLDEEKDQKVSRPDTDEVRDSKEKQTDESTRDKSNDESKSDEGKNLSPSPPGPDKDKDTDAEKSDQKSYDRVSKDNYSKPYTADRDDPVQDTGSGSAGSTTGDSGTATADIRRDNNRTISKSDVKDIEDIISSDPGSPGSTESPSDISSDISDTSPAGSQDSNLKSDTNISSNISSTNAEDAAFLNEFRDSKEAPDNIEITDYSFASLIRGREAVFEFGLEKNNIISISFIPEVTGGQVRTVVEMLKSTSTLINEAPPGIVYRNFNIWVGDAQFSPYKATDAKVNFKVEKDWILSNSIDAEAIVLYGHVNGWYPLVTERTGEDDAYVYYTAQTSRFSLFAIVSTDTYGLAEDPTAGVTSSGIIGKSGILGGSDTKGDTDEVPYYNTYMSAALLLVSLFVAGAAGIAGLKYITRPEISGDLDEKDNMQFKK